MVTLMVPAVMLMLAMTMVPEPLPAQLPLFGRSVVRLPTFVGGAGARRNLALIPSFVELGVAVTVGLMNHPVTYFGLWCPQG